MALPFSHDIGLGPVDERRIQRYVCIAIQSHILHELKRLGEIGATVGIDKVITPMHRGCDGLIPACRRDPVSDRQHDCVAVGHNGDAHGIFGVMPVGYGNIIGQRRARQCGPNAAHVDDIMGDAKTRCT